jgi:DNA-binding LacI/PurR family transcriptional regulator
MPGHERQARAVLRDVAERAAVSVGTASNAFNRPELVSVQARERVLAAARELGYAGPDPTARRLRTGRAGALGLIFTDRLEFAFTDQVAARFLRGVALGIREGGAGLLIVPTSPSRDEAARIVRDAAVDGFIVYSTAADDPRLEAALARSLPVTVVDQPRDLPLPFIGIDDRAAARLAAEHVRELGHERVAVLSFAETAEPDGGLPFELTAGRLAGYRDVFSDIWERLPVRVCRQVTVERGREVAVELLSSDTPPTAILAMGDAIAAGALLAASSLGIRVPNELTIVGIDDSPLAALTSPPLTTVAQPHEQKGRLAAESLIAAIAGRPQAESRVILSAELQVRGSSAPPASV